eukprot:15453199-Alexandrium_andersonii.AAC.1
MLFHAGVEGSPFPQEAGVAALSTLVRGCFVSDFRVAVSVYGQGTVRRSLAVPGSSESTVGRFSAITR